MTFYMNILSGWISLGRKLRTRTPKLKYDRVNFSYDFLKEVIPLKQLTGKTAIVTGASSGIGAAIAVELASEGANVVLAARRTEKLAETEQQIKDQGNDNVLSVQTDISKQEDVEDLIKQAENKFGQIDLLVNNAGQVLTGPVRSGKVDEWEKMIDTNIKGTLYAIDGVLPSMVERSSGHIINIASVSGFEVTKKLPFTVQPNMPSVPFRLVWKKNWQKPVSVSQIFHLGWSVPRETETHRGRVNGRN